MLVLVGLAENMLKTFRGVSKFLLKEVILRTAWFNNVGVSGFFIAKFQAYRLRGTLIFMAGSYLCKHIGSKKYLLILICLTFTTIYI